MPSPIPAAVRDFPHGLVQLPHAVQDPTTDAATAVAGALCETANTNTSARAIGQSTVPVATLPRQTNLKPSAKQVADLLAIIAAPMGMACLSLAGAPMTAMALVVTVPLAALYCFRGTPAESAKSVSEILGGLLQELTPDELQALVTKIEPHRDALDLATVVQNTLKALDNPHKTPLEIIRTLPVKDWARASLSRHPERERKIDSYSYLPLACLAGVAAVVAWTVASTFQAARVEPPAPLNRPWRMGRATASENLEALGNQTLPIRARLKSLKSYVAAEHNATTDKQLHRWYSRPYQRGLEAPGRPCASNRHAPSYLTRQPYQLDHVLTPNTQAFTIFNSPIVGDAGALTELGIASPPGDSTSSMLFPGAVSAAMRAPSASSIQPAQQRVNVALLSGRAYLLQRSQRALEEALPGWMLASPDDQRRARESLHAYGGLLPQLAEIEQGIAGIPDRVARYFDTRIKNALGLHIDSRNTTFRSQTWRTRTHWDMAGVQPVPPYYSSDPEKKTIDRSLWEAAIENFNGDETLSEFFRGDTSAEHLGVISGTNKEIIQGLDSRQWIDFIRREDLGAEAQRYLDHVMQVARPVLLESYPVALRADLDVAEIGGLPAGPAELLRRVLANPDWLPTTPSGRLWQVSPLRLLDAEAEAFVFHTEVLTSTGNDAHTDGGVLYIPNLCLSAFSSAGELGELVKKIIGNPTALALFAERVPLDVRDLFIRSADVAVQSNDMRDLSIELGERLPSGLWRSMYEREVAFRKRNLETLIRPTAKVDMEASIERRMMLYRAVMGLYGSFSGLPLVGPIFMGPNVAAFANTAIQYTQLRGRQGAESANKLLPELLTDFLSIVDFDADDARSTVAGRFRTGIGAATPLPAYFRASDSTLTSAALPDSRGIMRADHRTYVRMDSGEVVEVDVRENGQVHPIARWHDINVSGPEIIRQPDGRWSPRPEGVAGLPPVELFRQMLPDEVTPWSDQHVQALIDDLGLDQTMLHAIWDGQLPSSLLLEHVARYQHLVDLDALPDALESDSSPIPKNMLPVLAQALADRTEQPLEIYRLDRHGGAPSLNARYTPRTTGAPTKPPVKVVERNGVEFFPLASHAPPAQDVPHRLSSLIDSVIELVPGFGVNPSLWRSNWKGVRRGQVMTELIDHIQQERAMFQQLCLEQISMPPASLDAPTEQQSQILRTFPGIPLDLLDKVTTELNDGLSAGGPIDMGRAGNIVMDHYALARRNDILFRFKHGPHTLDSETAYLTLLVTDPHWPPGLVVEVIPSMVGYDESLYRDTTQPIRSYGEDRPGQRHLNLYRRDDGTYAPIIGSSGDIHPLATHAPDDLGSAILLAMEPGDHRAWTSDRARSDVDGWVMARAKKMGDRALGDGTPHGTSALTPAALSSVTPESISLVNRIPRQDGIYEVDGKDYIYAYGQAYRLKKEQALDGTIEGYRIIAPDSLEASSTSSTYVGLDYAPRIVRDEHGAWKLDEADRLWALHKLGALTKGIDVHEARVLLDVTDISIRELRDIQLGKKETSPELGDAIIRARMRSAIRSLQKDPARFDDLEDPTPALVSLTKLDHWPRDTSLEVSDEDGQVSVYGPPDATRTVRIGLDALHPPLLESLQDLLGRTILDEVADQAPASSLVARLGEKLSRIAGRYPTALFDAWYFKWQDPDSMLAQELMQREPGLTKLAAEEILVKGKLKRKADLLPGGQLTNAVKTLAQASSMSTRIQRLRESLRSGHLVTTGEKAALIDAIRQLPGWEAGLVIHANGDMLLRQKHGTTNIRQDGELFQVTDTNGRVIGTAQDIYAAMSLALDPAVYARLGLVQGDDHALRSAVWNQADRDPDFFRRHAEAMDETIGSGRISCRVRRTLDGPDCAGGTSSIPQAAQDAKRAVEESQASVEKFAKSQPRNRHSSASSGNSASSRSSASSARSQTLGGSNFASIIIETPIKGRNRFESVKFPKMDETRLVTGMHAMVSRSTGVKESPPYFISSSLYRDQDLPKLTRTTSIVEQMDAYRGGVSVPGRHFKYKVRLSNDDSLTLDRPSDTEASLLEYVHDQLQSYMNAHSVATPADLRGRMTVYTELTPCDSCQNIIRQFKEEYPNIELNVYFSFKNSRERSITPLQEADIHLWTPN